MSPWQGSIESLFLQGEAGRLEALLNLGAPSAEYACVVCHPHPLYGGTMHNKVVFRTMKALNGFGFPVLRFNFRGAGSSAGEHDDGRGEIADVRVALDYLSERFGLPLLFAGFSFGAAVGLRAAVVHPKVNGLILVGTPVNADGRAYRYELLQESTLPKLMVSGNHDQFASVAQLEGIFDAAGEPKRLVVVPGADHFFAGHLEELREAVRGWVSEVVGVRERG
ncbi:MAG: alpha/beta fold hydrolase [Candidatus Korobacteraceae bacterium]